MSDHFSFLPPRECEQPYTVTEINGGIAAQLESGNTLIWVEGEISTWRPSSSGHCYFRLKDASSQIPAVLWRSTARDLTFSPADGMAVMAIASIRVYQRGGYYQLDVHRMQPLGEGALHIAFMKLKRKLEREGLFDPSFKQPLPLSVQRIGVITSKTGAAIRDIVRVIGSRAPRTELVLCDVAVQGDRAPRQIVKAIENCNEYGGFDCLIVGRGGGSLEDLWAFNEEIVARAVFVSKIPVISAVGHEIDFTITDYVADIRAPTPSSAAETAVGDQKDNRRLFNLAAERFRNGISRHFTAAMREFQYYMVHNAFRRPVRTFHETGQYRDDLQGRLQRTIVRTLHDRTAALSAAGKQLAALNPLSVLSRGYSVASTKDGTVVRSSGQLRNGDLLHLRFHKGSAYSRIEELFSEDDARLN